MRVQRFSFWRDRAGSVPLRWRWLTLTLAAAALLTAAPATAAYGRRASDPKNGSRTSAAQASASRLPASLRARLGRLLRGLPAGEAALIEQALARRPPARVERAVARLLRLPAAQRKGMIVALRNGLGPLTQAQRRAVIDGLLGVARGRERRALGALADRAERQVLGLLHEFVDAVPAYTLVHDGYGQDPRDQQFVEQVYQLMAANLAGLIEHALARVRPAARALLVQADVASTLLLAQQTGGTGGAGVVVLMLQSAQAQQFVQQSAYQAGQDCVYAGGCSDFDLFVSAVSGIPVMEPIIQQDLIDCAYSPICLPVEARGVIDWIRQQIHDSQTQYELVRELQARFEQDTAEAASGWIEAFAYAGG